MEMIKTRSAGGFSTYVSLIIFLSNLIRIFWWFSERFSIVLLATSMVRVIVQLVVIFFWVKISTDEGRKPFRDEAFWYWSNYSRYAGAIVSLTCNLGLATYLAGDI